MSYGIVAKMVDLKSLFRKRKPVLILAKDAVSAVASMDKVAVANVRKEFKFTESFIACAARPAPEVLDTLDIIGLNEDPELLERTIVAQQTEAAEDADIHDLLLSIYLLPNRDADFIRFESSVEFATILKLLSLNEIKPGARIVEVGGGPGFLSWALTRAGYVVDLVEPNQMYNTGVGYLKTRFDAEALKTFSNYADWHESSQQYDCIITRNCMHHFYNIGKVALGLRQKLKKRGKWLAFREWYADNTQELALALKDHPYSQRFKLYEWPYPAHHYVECLELVGFDLTGVVPLGYANNCLSCFSETTISAEQAARDRELDMLLVTNPSPTVQAFWAEVYSNRFRNSQKREYTRPQLFVLYRRD